MERYGVLELLEILWISGFVFEGLAKELTLGWVEEIAFGEDNFELEVKISKAHWVFVERHAQLFDGFSFFILQYFPRTCRNNILFPVQMFDGRSNTCQSLKQCNFLMINEICSKPLEDFMFLDVDPYIYITSHCTRILVTLAIENIVVGIRYTLLDSYFNHFFALFYPLSLTSFASIGLVDYYTESAAGLAWSLNLGIHSWSKLGQFYSNP